MPSEVRFRTREEIETERRKHATNCMWMMTRIEPCDCGAGDEEASE